MESRDSIAEGREVRASQPPLAADDFAYDGVAGRTRRTPLHVTMPGGVIKSIPVHRVINVGTDPDLREPALTGALHRFESGEELAIAFVYHDPAARKFALVLPSSLRHLELTERARLFSELASDSAHPIPGYVRNFAVAIGLEELADYLSLPGPVGSPTDAARREAELRARETDLFGLQAELQERERELDLRELALQRRSEELAEREREVAAARRQSIAQRQAAPDVVGDEDVEEVVDVEDLEEVAKTVPAPSRGGLVAEGALLGGSGELPAAAEVQEVRDDELQVAGGAGEEVQTVDVTELSEVDADRSGHEVRAMVGLLESTEARGEAALELCRRGGRDEMEAVRRSLGRMTPDETAAVFAALARRGEPAAEVLLRSLDAPEPYVRHGAALALGEIGLRRSLDPLSRMVRTEPEDLWQEVARVVGAFGRPAVMALGTAFKGADDRDERHAYALAALADRGCEAEVRAMRERGEGRISKIAREAMALREVVRVHEEVVQGKAPLEEGDRIRSFSRRFREALGQA